MNIKDRLEQKIRELNDARVRIAKLEAEIDCLNIKLKHSGKK